MSLEMTLDYRLRWLDFDCYGRIQPVTIFDMCQDMATLHAEQMGIGRDDMLKQGVFWALIRMKYELVHAPQHFQTLSVRTWPHSASNFSFQRDFMLSDEDGGTVAKATSEWVLMNAETRKFARMESHYDGSRDFSEERAFEKKPRKIKTFREGNRPVYTVAPAFSDIDVNGHVNNARYLRFVSDALALDEHSAIRTLQMDYRYEVMPGAPIDVHTLVENGIALLKGIREDGEIAFACAIELDNL